jgi:YD repeat-containing protein
MAPYNSCFNISAHPDFLNMQGKHETSMPASTIQNVCDSIVTDLSKSIFECHNGQIDCRECGHPIEDKEIPVKVKILMLCATLGFSSLAQAQDTTTYTYDALGRLAGSKTSGSQSTTTNIGYDAAGNRTNYTVTGAANGSGDPGASAGAPTVKRFVVIPLNGFTIIPIN